MNYLKFRFNSCRIMDHEHYGGNLWLVDYCFDYLPNFMKVLKVKDENYENYFDQSL